MDPLIGKPCPFCPVNVRDFIRELSPETMSQSVFVNCFKVVVVMFYPIYKFVFLYCIRNYTFSVLLVCSFLTFWIFFPRKIMLNNMQILNLDLIILIITCVGAAPNNFGLKQREGSNRGPQCSSSE